MRPLPLPVAVEVCKSNHKGIFSLRRNGVTFPKMFFTTIRFLPHCNRIVVYSTVDARHIRLQPLIINVVVSRINLELDVTSNLAGGRATFS